MGVNSAATQERDRREERDDDTKET